MKIADVKANAFAMPLTSPAFPRGPYRFTAHLRIGTLLHDPGDAQGRLVRARFAGTSSACACASG